MSPALRAVHAEAGDIAPARSEIVVADPGERQIGQHLVLLGQLVEGDRVARRRRCSRSADSTTPLGWPVVPEV